MVNRQRFGHDCASRRRALGAVSRTRFVHSFSPDMLLVLASLIICLIGFLTGRAGAAVIFNHRRVQIRSRRRTEACRLAVFLGSGEPTAPARHYASHRMTSGGHTSEALALVSALDFARYAPRTYIISEGDTLSAQKAIALETSRTSAPSTVKVLPVDSGHSLTCLHQTSIRF
jgi:hypothetical protein